MDTYKKYYNLSKKLESFTLDKKGLKPSIKEIDNLLTEAIKESSLSENLLFNSMRISLEGGDYIKLRFLISYIDQKLPKSQSLVLQINDFLLDFFSVYKERSAMSTSKIRSYIFILSDLIDILYDLSNNQKSLPSLEELLLLAENELHYSDLVGLAQRSILMIDAMNSSQAQKLLKKALNSKHIEISDEVKDYCNFD